MQEEGPPDLLTFCSKLKSHSRICQGYTANQVCTLHPGPYAHSIINQLQHLRLRLLSPKALRDFSDSKHPGPLYGWVPHHRLAVCMV